MEYVLETNALTKHYRGSIALDGLTMCNPRAQCTALSAGTVRGKRH